jgi:hypothetical protein
MTAAATITRPQPARAADSRLIQALKAKYGSPEKMLRALGLPANLLAVDQAPAPVREPSRPGRDQSGQEDPRADPRAMVDDDDPDGGAAERIASALQMLKAKLSPADYAMVEKCLNGEAADELQPAMDARRRADDKAANRRRKLAKRFPHGASIRVL